MGSEAHEARITGTGLAVNQDEVRPQAAVAMVFPLPGRRWSR